MSRDDNQVVGASGSPAPSVRGAGGDGVLQENASGLGEVYGRKVSAMLGAQSQLPSQSAFESSKARQEEAWLCLALTSRVCDEPG
jgi:hypothetical protein